MKNRTVLKDPKATKRRYEKKIVLNHVVDTVKNSVAVPGGRKVSCGECVKCLLADCGHCSHCSDKPEFGGRGKLVNRVCIKKVCRNKVWSDVMVTPSLVKGKKVKR